MTRQDVRDALAMLYGDSEYDRNEWRRVSTVFDDAWPDAALVPRPEPREPESPLKLRSATESVGWVNSVGPLAVSPTFEKFDAAVRPASAPSLEQYRMAVEDRNFAVARQAELETRIAELEAASAPSRPLEALIELIEDLQCGSFAERHRPHALDNETCLAIAERLRVLVPGGDPQEP